MKVVLIPLAKLSLYSLGINEAISSVENDDVNSLALNGDGDSSLLRYVATLLYSRRRQGCRVILTYEQFRDHLTSCVGVTNLARSGAMKTPVPEPDWIAMTSELDRCRQAGSSTDRDTASNNTEVSISVMSGF